MVGIKSVNQSVPHLLTEKQSDADKGRNGSPLLSLKSLHSPSKTNVPVSGGTGITSPMMDWTSDAMWRTDHVRV